MGNCIAAPSLESSPNSSVLWQDRKLVWDQRKSSIELRQGEIVSSKWENVEDTKGRNGLGTLTVTNLRLIWLSNNKPLQNNISLGLMCLCHVHYNMLDSPTFGRIRGSQLSSTVNHTRFEFCFAVRENASSELFQALNAALQRYRATRVFRDVLLKEPRLTNERNELVTHYGENVIMALSHADNVAVTEKFAGEMLITNRRIVWVSHCAPRLVNVNLPFVQIKQLYVRKTARFGSAIVLHAQQTTNHGAYMLGFSFADASTTNEVLGHCQKLLTTAKMHPFYGPAGGVVQYMNDQTVLVEPPPSEDDVNLAGSGSDSPDVVLEREISRQSILAHLMSSYSTVPVPSELRPPTTTQEDQGCSASSTGTLHLVSDVPRVRMSNEPLKSVSPDSPMKKHCVVCMSSDVEMAFDPCGHLSTCGSCAEKLENCPICRVHVNKRLRIFLNGIL